MKTFDEAIVSALADKPADGLNPVQEQNMGGIQETVMASQAANELAHTMTAQFMTKQPFQIHLFALSMLACGVMIGIEMEKPDQSGLIHVGG